MTGIVGVGALVVAVAGVGSGLALRRREQPGAVPFAALLALLAVMAVLAVLGAEYPPTVDGPAFASFVLLAVTWLVLALEYTGRGPAVTGARLGGLAAFAALPILGVAIAPFVPDWAIQFLFAANFVLQAATLSAIAYGVLVVARSAITYDDLPRGGALLLAILGTGIGCLSVWRVVSDGVGPGTDAAVTLTILASIAVPAVVVQNRYRVFEHGPSAGHLARETVLEELPDAVAITDREDRLMDYNRAAERAFDLEKRGALDDPVSEALGFDGAIGHEGDGNGGDAAVDGGIDAEGRLALETADGRREFEVGRLPLSSRSSERIGRAYLLRDVTERRTHEQRLEVLNRVLRHNLRNDLDAIHGFAEVLEDDPADVDPVELAIRIRETANGLSALGTTVTRTERLLASEPSLESVDVVAVVDRLVDDLEGSNGTATVEVPGPVEIRTDERHLAAALGEVLENAFEHTGSDPCVEVAVRATGSGATIEVRDDGPGIPERERAVLTEGEETPLRHGSGLGLWLAHWLVTRLGGALEFRANEPRGSVVVVRVPDRSRPNADELRIADAEGTT